MGNHSPSWMMILTYLFVAALTLPVLASPYQERAANSASGRYIITLKDGVSKDSVYGRLGSQRRLTEKGTEQWSDVLNGFAAKLDDEELAVLRQSSDVVSIEEDGMMYALAATTQTNANWGLGRLSSRTLLTNQNASSLTFNFTYDSSGGAGVDIYVLDTGVRTTHVEFEGRARIGAVFGGYAPTDGNGHGTHVAGTAAGKNVGVAKKASIVAVRVLSDQGSATVAQVISGVNWIYTAATTSGRPSVVLIALGGSANTALDTAVTALTDAGIHVVVAAGSSATGTENSSPGRVPSVITVAASTIADARAPFTNYGPGIDIFAPGVNIYSSWHTSDTAYNTLSGNSMAAAFVAGAIAYLIGLEGNISPAAMDAKLDAKANKGQLSNIPSGTLNYLVYIGV